MLWLLGRITALGGDGTGDSFMCCAVLCLDAQSYPAPCNPVACQAPLSTWILQARILEWDAMPSSRGSSQPRDRTYSALPKSFWFRISEAETEFAFLTSFQVLLILRSRGPHLGNSHSRTQALFSSLTHTPHTWQNSLWTLRISAPFLQFSGRSKNRFLRYKLSNNKVLFLVLSSSPKSLEFYPSYTI